MFSAYSVENEPVVGGRSAPLTAANTNKLPASPQIRHFRPPDRLNVLNQVAMVLLARVFGHPSRVIKRQFEHVKVRYRGLAKNTAHVPRCLP